MARWFFLFFLSGFSGLVYEVVWTRMMADVLGSAAVSMTVVFSVFLLGLASGAAVFSRVRSTGAAALSLYAKLEFGIAASALLVTVCIKLVGTPIAVLAPGSESFGASLTYAFVVSALLLAVPTILMGGTLPVLLSGLSASARPHSVVATLYGWNTLGASVGAVTAGFVLIWTVGLFGTVMVAAAANVAVGVATFALIRGRQDPAALAPHDSLEPPKDQQAEGPVGTRERVGVAFLSGAVVLAYEVLWGRMARFILGDRTLAVAALLFVFIAALGIASIVGPALARRLGVRRAKLSRPLGVLFLAGGALHLALVPLAVATINGGGLTAVLGDLSGTSLRLLAMSVLAAPAILVLGGVFPLLAWGSQAVDDGPAEGIGRLYWVNTMGAVLGAFAAAFLLSRLTGTILGFRVVTTISAAAGVWLIAEGRSAAVRPAAVVTAVLLVGFVAPNRADGLFLVRADEELVSANEDEYGVQVLTRTRAGTMRVRNNRISLIYDLGHPQTTHAQQMAGHWAVLLAENARSVLNIGTGYGITAGSFTLYPTLEHITTIEILPFLIDHFPDFQPYNLGLLTDPRVEILQGDGRQYLLSEDGQYDIISVNVLDPYLPGSSALYTTDFWREVRSRLTPGGVMTQLIWGEDLELLVRGLEEVYPTVLYFEAYGGTSYNVVAFRDETPPEDRIAFDRVEREARAQLVLLEQGLPEQRLRALFDRAWQLSDDLHLRASASTGPLHTDDRPVLEYRWVTGAEGVSGFDSPLVRY